MNRRNFLAAATLAVPVFALSANSEPLNIVWVTGRFDFNTKSGLAAECGGVRQAIRFRKPLEQVTDEEMQDAKAMLTAFFHRRGLV